MITDKDIDNLADLSRLSLGADEKASYKKDLNTILDYVSEITKVGVDSKPPADTTIVNAMRDDVVTTETGEYTESLVGSAPVRKDNYVQVKKVL
jgi:aspartyl/glutamyl-tRNA(Asn/Gln) amidotransferase C subunit